MCVRYVRWHVNMRALYIEHNRRERAVCVHMTHVRADRRKSRMPAHIILPHPLAYQPIKLSRVNNALIILSILGISANTRRQHRNI